jgi:glycine/D-amino acid oxidase-like deaminating enzyme
MTSFIDHSIDLLNQVRLDSQDRIRLTHRGYALATRQPNIDVLLENVGGDYRTATPAGIRFRDRSDAGSYIASLPEACTGVDVLTDANIIRKAFPAFDTDIRNVIHVRRAGDLDSHQLGQYFLEHFRGSGGKSIRGEVTGIEKKHDFQIMLADQHTITAERLVVAAGPFINVLLANLGERLPVQNILQQKLAFEDVLQALPREQPFAVDLDAQTLDWSAEEREWLAGDERYGYLAEAMPGNVHRRPDGGADRRWLRLGWAYNADPSDAAWSPVLDDHFPEIVLRCAARLNPALRAYYGRLPSVRTHYGGYYTMTEENLPIIGPLATEGAFVVAALSGFGTMAACAAGESCARWICDGNRSDYAARLSLQRYRDVEFMNELTLSKDRGVL